MFRRAPLPIDGVWAGALLLAAALALYWSGLRHPLLFDDYHLGAYSLKTYYADAAMASYERALDLNPGNASAHYNYGVLLLESGRRDLFVRGHFVIACKARIPQACELLERAR